MTSQSISKKQKISTLAKKFILSSSLVLSRRALLLRSPLLIRTARNNGYYYYDDGDDDENDFVKVHTTTTTTKTKDEIFGIRRGINLPIEKKTTRHLGGERVRGGGIRGRDGRVLRGDTAETSRREICSRERRRRVRRVRPAERSKVRGV